MPTITYSHKKLKFSLAAVLILLFTVASFSFGTGYAKRIVFPEQTVSENPQIEQSASQKSVFASIFSVFYRSSADDDSLSALITVNDPGDTTDLIPGNGSCADAAGKCTLRAAIQEANARAGADTINFNFTDPQTNTIQLDPSISPKELAITEAVAINGPGARLLTISGNPASTAADIFNVSSSQTTTTKISGITIQKSGRHGISNTGKLELADIAIKDNLKAGIYNTAKLTVNQALIHNNSDGGIRLISTSNAVNISNTTITGNSSTDSGGGINTASGDVTLNNVTISHNYAPTSGGGLFYNGQGAGVNIRNTIIANNTPVNNPDIFAVAGATFNTRGNNLIGKNSGNNGFATNATNGDKVGTMNAAINPLLGPLQNNGGQTDTRALLTGSPARDSGNTCVQNLTCTQNTNPALALGSDQRGTNMPRSYEGGIDMGAFEIYYPQSSITSLSPTNRGTNRGAFELTVNGSNFVAESKVKWNGQDRATTFVSNNQLKANISSADVATAGSYQVTVVNPSPNPGQSAPFTFTVADCSYTLSQSTIPFTTAGGNGSFDLTTQGGCPWTAQSNASWLTFNNGSLTASGTDSATIRFTVQPNTGRERTGIITVGNKTVTVSQPYSCTFNLSETSKSFSSAQGSGSVILTASDPETCSWTVTKDQTWITVDPTTSTGTRILNYSVTANTGAARQGSFTVGGQRFSISQAPGNCTYTFNPIEQTFTASGGSGSFTVTTGSGCPITPSPTQNWITVTGTNNGTVNFTVQPNTGTTNRTGAISIGGQSFTVKQDAACDYTINPAINPATIPGSGGNGSFTVAVNTGCSWTATADSWITITNPSGSGNRTVEYTVAPNPSSTPRVGTITVAGKTHKVNQAAACTYTLSPANILNFSNQAGEGNVDLTTQNGCAWTAQSDPNHPWLTVKAGSGSGTNSQKIFFTLQANTGPERTGIITIGNQTLRITQLSGCVFSLTPTSANVLKTLGTYTFDLGVNNPSCNWTATSNTPWISIDPTTTSGTGAKTIKYTVQANTGPERPGSIAIGGLTFSVIQQSGCTYSLSPTSVNVGSAGSNGNIALTVNNPACGWTARSDHPWIRITTNESGAGSTTVSYTVDRNTGASRVGTLTIAGQTFTVNQAAGCIFTLAPESVTVPSGAANNHSFNITANDQTCTWTATTNTPWISINQDSRNGNGSRQINYSVLANTGPAREDGSITITSNNQTWTFRVSQQSGCTYQLSSSEASFQREGGPGSFILTTNDQRCGWRATVNGDAAAWLTFSGNTSNISGTGTATITFNVAENFVPQRTGTISVGGLTFTVNQSNGCRFTLFPSSADVDAAAGTRSFSVNSGAGCRWSASTTDSWITFNGRSGDGNGTVTFNYAANDGPLRTGTIKVTGENGQTGGQVINFAVNQTNGCRFTLEPTSFPNIPASGASHTVTVTASNGACTWSAAVEGDSSWITVTNGTNRTGSGTLNFNVLSNNGLQRSGTLKIANQLVNVTQVNGCTYELLPAEMSIDEIGGDRSFEVKVSNAQCTWTATRNVDWITITSVSGTGNGTVRFTVPRNPTDDERIAKISVGGEVAANRRDFTIIQVSLTVRNTFDSGSGSLRQAVINANRSASNDVINFAPNVAGTIRLDSGEIKIGDSSASGTLEIRGPGANILTVSGGGVSRVFNLDNAIVTIKGLTLSGGNGVGEGSDGSRKVGGAVRVRRGSAAFTGVIVTGNDIMGVPGQGAQNMGGGIYFEDGSNHRIENSTISGNSGSNGGGIANLVGFAEGLKIYNTTISGNMAMRDGGGIYVAGETVLRNVTIANNKVTGPGGTGAGLGIYAGFVEIGNTIIAENIGQEITYFSGTPYSIGNNLIGDTPEDVDNTGIPFPYNSTDRRGVKPHLSMLSQFGGSTLTVALMPGSPAIDGGKNENAPPSLTTDQRGAARNVGARIDIGAYEYNIEIMPPNTVLPGGAVGVYYVGQQIRGSRINPGSTPDQFSYELVGDGELPPGLILQNGFINGTPTLTGKYDFAVKATGSTDGMAGTNKYSITIGCSVSLSPQSQNVNPEGDQFSINVTAQEGCVWSAMTTDNWITNIQPSNGNGNGAITFRVSANTGGSRTGKIRIGSAEFTVNQAGTANCTYSIPEPKSRTFTAGGGNASFDLTTQVGCPWEAKSDKEWVTFASNSATGTGSGTVSYSVAANTGIGRSATITVGGQTYAIAQSGLAAPRTAFDFDGDGKSDMTVFRPSNASWYIYKSSGGFDGLQFGATEDKLAPADYDGDGKTDVAVFREGNWYYNSSLDGNFKGKNWGIPTDVPVPGDYDGDRKADFAVFRSGNWYILQSSDNLFNAVQFGIATDKPVPADYDGDGRTDIAVYRDGAWYWLKSGDNNSFTGIQFGIAGDKPVVGDYDGDGKADPSVIRGAIWYFQKTTAGFSGTQFGIATDLPAPADYDGDGKTDVAVFREGAWYYNSSLDGKFNGTNWGVATDKPIQGAFIP